MKLAICIISVSRPQQTLIDTIHWMRTRDDLSQVQMAISVGRPDASYAEGIEGITLLRTSEQEWKDWGADSVHGGYQLTRNMLKALRWLAKSDADVCVFAEDDIEVAQNWLTRIRALTQAMDGKFGLSCCSSHPAWCFGAKKTVGTDAIVRFEDPRLFWGNQLMVYPKSTIGSMASHVQRSVASWSTPTASMPETNWLLFGDQATKMFFHETGVPLYVSIPSLARHTGVYNTWTGKGGHSHAFRDHPTARWEG